MNKDQLKGSLKEAEGKLQQKLGDLTGNRDQQTKGLSKQVEGKLRRTLGNVEQAVKDAKTKP